MRECVLYSRQWCLRISILRYNPRCILGLLDKLRLMCLILASYCDITYSEILQLVYPNFPHATEACSQCDDVMLYMLLEYLAALRFIHPIDILIQVVHI